MKRHLLAGVSLLALLVGGAPAQATMFTFDYTRAGATWESAIQTYLVPQTGLYDVSVAGAQGGNSNTAAGGLGAIVAGKISLLGGTTLSIVVGGQGVYTTQGAGGGGGSFVFYNFPPFGFPSLIAAAGGGGGAGGSYGSRAGDPGQTGPNGSTPYTGGQGGVGGHGGGPGGNQFGGNGGGGAGWFSNGGTGTGNFPGVGGSGPPSFAGGANNMAYYLGHGGFGGGGGGSGYGGGGGGGGFSGGGGGGYYGGGGGGSYLSAIFTSYFNVIGGRSGNGYVYISPVDGAPAPVSEPGAGFLLASGLAGLGFWRWRRRISFNW